MTKSLLEVSYICDGNPVCSDPRKANYFFMVCLGTRGVLPTNLNNMTSLPLLLNDKVTGDNFLSPSKYIEALTLLHCWIFTRSYTFFFIFFFAEQTGNMYAFIHISCGADWCETTQMRMKLHCTTRSLDEQEPPLRTHAKQQRNWAYEDRRAPLTTAWWGKQGKEDSGQTIRTKAGSWLPSKCPSSSF